MFKKTKIAAATITLLGAATAQTVFAGDPAASAVAIDHSGTKAQVLVFPYYNTNNGFSTSFNIRNTSSDTKAVKIRFRESKLSNDVLDFNAYLSPYDHFTLSVSPNASGQATLSTSDKTCTFPAIPAGGIAFKGNVYKNTTDVDAREGYLEVIEMGVIPTSAVLVSSATTKIADSVLHVNGVPKNCSVISTAWKDGTFTQGGANAYVDNVLHTTAALQPKNIDAPTGGLQGWSFLLDIAKGNAFVAMPVAIRNYQTATAATATGVTTGRGGAQHYRSDDAKTFLLPSLASGNSQQSVAVNAAGDDFVAVNWATPAVSPITAISGGDQGRTGSAIIAENDYATTTVGKAELALANGGAGPIASGANPFPVAHVLAATGFTNDYLVDSSAGVGTDWVVTFPMRKHGIYAGVTYNPNKDSSGNFVFATPLSGDVTMSATFYNREEGTSSVSDDFSPVASSPLALLPREVNVLSFGKTGETAVSKVLGSEYTKNVGVDFTSGWGDVNFSLANTSADSLAFRIARTFKDATGVTGVPALGFAAVHGNLTTSGGKAVVIGESVPHVFKK